MKSPFNNHGFYTFVAYPKCLIISCIRPDCSVGLQLLKRKLTAEQLKAALNYEVFRFHSKILWLMILQYSVWNLIGVKGAVVIVSGIY